VKKTKKAADSSFPGAYARFRTAYPGTAKSYDALASESRLAAGFDDKNAALLKLALAVGARLEGAVHSHTRRAIAAGATAHEARGVALLAVTTCGFPQSMAALTWVEDVVGGPRKKAGKTRRK
jgi:alkylhydroperoxidase/carboxymuconolactone decarboxylase family protein YurZ